ncbi:hypothetical protein, partial [Chamaesiphon sp. OTE_8_metabat_110]|uniref:hypothetical protein n=1 Tax=Chamaesiphon sp. OTE_8_metabat_110 TaxID=2964696 RepID=UPI00286C0D50
LLHYLKFNELPIPYSIDRDNRSMKISLEACAPPKRRSVNHTPIQQRLLVLIKQISSNQPLLKLPIEKSMLMT